MFQWIIAFAKKYEEITRYLIAGILTTLISLLVYFLCFKGIVCGVPSLERFAGRIATVVSWCIAVIFAFFVNKLGVFRSSAMDFHTLKLEFTLFVGCRLGTLLFDFAFIWVTVDYLSHTAAAADWSPFYLKIHGLFMKMVDEIIITVLNYVISKFLIFVKKENPK